MLGQDVHVTEFLKGWLVIDESQGRPYEFYAHRQKAEEIAIRKARVLGSSVFIYGEERTRRIN